MSLTKIDKLFGIDLRSLALFRMGLGLVILGDLISRAFDLKAFYTGEGVLPRVLLLEKASSWPASPPSLNLLSDSVTFQAFLFLLTGFFALALIVGFRTRFATFACWVLMTSLQVRNPLIRQAGDVLLQLYLFWSLFLPLGACWSLDQTLAPSRHNRPSRVLSGGTVALLLQVCFVYWFASLNKTGDAWRDGSALYYVFNLDALTTPLGHFLLNYPSLLTVLSYFTIWLERLGPLLAFVPICNGVIRVVLVFLFMGFHLGILLCLSLGPFPYFSMIGWLVFLPSCFWEKLGKPWPDYPPMPRSKLHWLTDIVALFLIAYVLLLNLTNVQDKKYKISIPKKYKWPAAVLGLNQTWFMFAPDPPGEDGWYVIPGKLRDGSEVDLFRGGGAPHWEKPKRVAATISTERWRKYLEFISLIRSPDYRRYYGQYLCQQWNVRHPVDEKIVSLEIVFIREKTLPPGQSPETERTVLWKGECL